MLLLALGVVAIERRRLTVAAGLVGVSSLAKAINLLWSVILVRSNRPDPYRWQILGVRGLLVTLPLGLWMLYLWLGNHESANMAGIRNFGLPLTGYVTEWATTMAELREASWGPARFSLLALISLTTQVAVLVIIRDWSNPWWRVGMVSCVLMVFLGDAVWEGHPGAATRVLLPMTFAFNLVLPRNRWFWLLFILGNLTVLPGLETVRAPFLWSWL